jgi:hypothetical protein
VVLPDSPGLHLPGDRGHHAASASRAGLRVSSDHAREQVHLMAKVGFGMP